MTDISNNDSKSENNTSTLKSPAVSNQHSLENIPHLSSSFKTKNDFNLNKPISKTSLKKVKLNLKLNTNEFKENNNILVEQIDRLGSELSCIQPKKIGDEEVFFRKTDNKNQVNNIFFDEYARKLINTLSDIERERRLNIFDIICYILKKPQKKDIENLILKTHFFRNERLMSLFSSLDVNIHEMMNKLVSHIKYEKKFKGNILFKEGDRGDKLYIIIKGEVGVLIHKEKTTSCTKIEYLKYLITLYLFQENSLVMKIILANKEIFRLEERGFFTLLLIFRFYHFYKENKYSKFTNNIKEFITNEKQIKEYIKKKQDYTPEEAINILNCDLNTINELFLFYLQTIDEINNYFQDFNSASDNKRQHFPKRNSILSINSSKKKTYHYRNNYINPTTSNELLSFVDLFEDSNRSIKNDEAFFDKLFGVYEISPYLIYESDVKNYIQRTDYSKIIKKIRNETIKFTDKLFTIKYYNYIEVNQMTTGNIFGELALINPNKKRTATIIMKEDCDFGTLIKQYYDLSIKIAQDKLRTKDILFFTEGPIFKGISYNTFQLNFLFRFKKKFFNNREYIFHKDQKRDKIYFIIKGEFQLSGNLTLKEMSEYIEKINIGGRREENMDIKKMLKKEPKFKQFYENKKLNIKFCVLKDKEILGLDDLTVNDSYLFDCKCVSQKAEVYELNSNILEKALEDKTIEKNYEDYLKLKTNFFIERLLIQRDSIAKNEYCKIKIFNLNKIQEHENTIAKNLSLNEYKSKNNPFFHNNAKVFFDTKKLNIFDDTKMNSKSNNNINKTSNYDKINNNYNTHFFNKSSSPNKKNKTRINQNNSKLFPLELKPSSKNYTSKISLKNLNVMKNFKSFTPINYQSTAEFNYRLQLKAKTTNFNLQPLLQKTFYSRTRTKLVPFLNKEKIKSKAKWIIKDVSPFVFKEFSEKITETRRNVKNQNFYIENQEIFNSLIDNSSNNFYKASNVSYRNKCFRADGLKNDSLNDIEINKKNVQSRSNFKSHNDNDSRKSLLQKIGIIDCLCLDKWEEKKRENNTTKKTIKNYWMNKK